MAKKPAMPSPKAPKSAPAPKKAAMSSAGKGKGMGGKKGA